MKKIELARLSSKMKDSGPWITFRDEQAKKTIIRRSFKVLPSSIEIALALEIDNAADRGEVFEHSLLQSEKEEDSKHEASKSQQMLNKLKENNNEE